jgi:N-acetylmuramoyl-L-alanine amidase
VKNLIRCTPPLFLLLGLVVLNTTAETTPLKVFSEADEIASLEVLEIQEAKYVLLREVSELFSGTVKSEHLTGRTTVTIMGKRIIVTLNQHRLMVDKEEYVLSNPPVSASGDIVVPVEFLTEIMPHVIGRQITLDQENWVLKIRREPFVDSNGSEISSPEPASSGFRVIIDPGHGGYDVGAKSKAGLFEKSLTLEIAQQVKSLLAEKQDVHVYLTRREDNHMTTAERVTFASKLHGHLLLSIHFNSSPSQRSSGFRIYINSNRMRLGTGMDLEADIFSRSDPSAGKLSEAKRFIPQSKWLAREIKERLEDIGLKGEEPKEAFLADMDNLSMPGVLVEVLYLSNPQDLMIISRPDFIGSVSQALADSILAFQAFMENRGFRSAG